MKEIEEQISEILDSRPQADGLHTWTYLEEQHREWKLNQLSTLIQEERKEAVEGLLNKCCNKCRDLLYSNYALQGQEKKKRSVEKLVREK